jgi:hypothetical protein
MNIFELILKQLASFSIHFGYTAFLRIRTFDERLERVQAK